MSLKRDLPTSTLSGFALSGLLILTLLNILLQNMPNSIQTAGNELLKLNVNEGVANAVTTVVVYFRGFDTLGEIAVLFIASLGVGLMLHSNSKCDIKAESNFMLQTASRLLFPIIMLFGIYVMIYGHLSPGGGFQGGVIIASGVLLLLISHKEFEIPHAVIVALETFAGVSYVLIGLIGLLVLDKFLGNFLPHDISQTGLLLSGGIIPIIYMIVGIKVGSEMSMIAQNLIKRSNDV
ncbi:hydrogen gas-evolving membrane-bound hydrogenase subunit E [Sulfurovum sp. CS9]|uniref:hydrogen gas-evolving membrane-bound hydrogenase subunit E n=1 Tax=Sulfurovum sp. CS9 TaxID=3391146 RepID=UPI0039EC6794